MQRVVPLLAVGYLQLAQAQRVQAAASLYTYLLPAGEKMGFGLLGVSASYSEKIATIGKGHNMGALGAHLAHFIVSTIWAMLLASPSEDNASDRAELELLLQRWSSPDRVVRDAPVTKASRCFDRVRVKVILYWNHESFDAVRRHLSELGQFRPDVAPASGLERGIQSIIDAARQA